MARKQTAMATTDHIDRVLELVDQVLDVGPQHDSSNIVRDPSVMPAHLRRDDHDQDMAEAGFWFGVANTFRTRVRTPPHT